MKKSINNLSVETEVEINQALETDGLTAYQLGENSDLDMRILSLRSDINLNNIFFMSPAELKAKPRLGMLITKIRGALVIGTSDSAFGVVFPNNSGNLPEHVHGIISWMDFSRQSASLCTALSYGPGLIMDKESQKVAAIVYRVENPTRTSWIASENKTPTLYDLIAQMKAELKESVRNEVKEELEISMRKYINAILIENNRTWNGKV